MSGVCANDDENLPIWERNWPQVDFSEEAIAYCAACPGVWASVDFTEHFAKRGLLPKYDPPPRPYTLDHVLERVYRNRLLVRLNNAAARLAEDKRFVVQAKKGKNPPYSIHAFPKVAQSDATVRAIATHANGQRRKYQRHLRLTPVASLTPYQRTRTEVIATGHNILCKILDQISNEYIGASFKIIEQGEQREQHIEEQDKRVRRKK